MGSEKMWMGATLTRNSTRRLTTPPGGWKQRAYTFAVFWTLVNFLGSHEKNERDKNKMVLQKERRLEALPVIQ